MFLLILIFVIIHIIQAWLILTYKILVRGGIIIGVIEGVEFPLLLWLIFRGGLLGFLTVVVVETTQWIFLAFMATKG